MHRRKLSRATHSPTHATSVSPSVARLLAGTLTTPFVIPLRACFGTKQNHSNTPSNHQPINVPTTKLRAVIMGSQRQNTDLCRMRPYSNSADWISDLVSCEKMDAPPHIEREVGRYISLHPARDLAMEMREIERGLRLDIQRERGEGRRIEPINIEEGKL